MKQIDFSLVDKWVEMAQTPLDDSFLESIPRNKGDCYYRFFYHMIIEMEPKIVLEIGVWKGQCFAHIIEATWAYDFGGVAIGIDKNLKRLGPWMENIPNPFTYHLIEKDSTKLDYSFFNGEIGIVFQDSSHHYRASQKEWDLIFPHLGKNAIWVCDDITEDFHDPLVDPPGKGMVQYFEERPGRKKLYKDVLHYGNTMGVILL